ncbi:mechanosensitive ion channel family protein [Halorhabdus salina]|uniref:mechanosensitive ion channel family protein n=1 Tax=Halorhabdus salina TaxID=2750670 RepID=UPI0015EEA91D|nr:mechanosensitive ion channel family protein [Halorhabdus salina]
MQLPAVIFPLIFSTPTTETSGITRVAELVPAWIPSWVIELLAVIVVLVGAWLLSRGLVTLFGRRIARRFRRPSLTRTFLSGIRAGVFVLALLVILRIFGLKLGDIALSVTVFSAVVGVVLAPIVGSVISGVFLLADQPYEIGDMVELVDTNQRGFVEDITLRYTKIFTLDNTFLVIPNGAIRDRDVVNYSAEDPRTRRAIDVVVTYEGDLDTARDRFERAARGVEGVIEGGPDIRVGAARYPAGPTCYVNEFGDHGVKLTLRYWIKEPYKLLATRSRVQTAIWEALEDIDVEIAYPHSHLMFDETSGELPIRHDENRASRAGDSSIRPPSGGEPTDGPSPD